MRLWKPQVRAMFFWLMVLSIAFDDLKKSVSSEKERTDDEDKSKQLSQRYFRTVAGYANVDFGDALERAQRIEDEQTKLQTLIRLATRVLVPDREIPPPQYLNLNAGPSAGGPATNN